MGSIVDNSLLLKIQKVFESEGFCLIGCDGLCGAGKTTFAKDLRRYFTIQNIQCVVIHLDNFIKEKKYRSIYATLHDYDILRVKKELLLPLRDGQVTNFRLYDWDSDSFKDSISLKPKDIIIVEGVNSCDKEIKKFFDICIFINTKKELREKRVALRGDFTKEEFRHWSKSEKDLFNNRDIEKYYDFVYNSLQ